MLNQTLTDWSGKLHINGKTVSPPSLPSGHYLECTSLSAIGCRVFDALGNVVAGATHVETHLSNSSADSIDVTVEAIGRAELVIIEVNESTIIEVNEAPADPQPARSKMDDDDEQSPGGPTITAPFHFNGRADWDANFTNLMLDLHYGCVRI